MTLVLLGITLIYLYLIGRFIYGFDKVKEFKIKGVKPETTFSIVIPFRNEAKNLPSLLGSLSTLDYPRNLFEILLIDDDSQDHSVKIILDLTQDIALDIRVINNERFTTSPKKDAIGSAIKRSKHEWILTTDADCTFDPNWLRVLNDFIQVKKPKMVVGPVAYIATNSFLERFQSLDFLSLMGATIGGFGIKRPFLCNGANLSYTRDVFLGLNGFEGNDMVASGDDIFLMEKVLQEHPDAIQYLKHPEAIVSTKPEGSLSQLISQRRRWAAKTSSYSNSYGKLVGSVVLLMNFSILAAIFLGVFGVVGFKMIGYAFLIKFCIDLWLIYKTAQFFNSTRHLSSYALSSLFYPFFNVYVAITSWYSGYSWKGRRFKK